MLLRSGAESLVRMRNTTVGSVSVLSKTPYVRPSKRWTKNCWTTTLDSQSKRTYNCVMEQQVVNTLIEIFESQLAIHREKANRLRVKGNWNLTYYHEGRRDGMLEAIAQVRDAARRIK